MKLITRLTALATLLLVLAIGCQKNITTKNLADSFEGQFTTATVKQWYLHSYQLTNEWLTEWKVNKKIPQWENGIYRKSGNFEFLELPLLKQKKSLVLLASLGLSDAQSKSVFSSSLSRILFIRNSKNEVVVREVDYVPFLSFLEKNNFDISRCSYGKTGDDFTGLMIVKDWNSKIISMQVVDGGKITKNLFLPNTSKTAGTKGQRVTDCGMEEACMWYEDCTVVGDAITNNCGEPYMDPTDCIWVSSCSGGGDGDPCQVYGNCNDGGSGSQNPPPQQDPCTESKPKSDAATDLSKKSGFQSGKTSVQNAATDNHEHSVTFGRDAAGNITVSSLSNGGNTSGTVNTQWPGAFADLHNHPNNTSPSAADMYNLIQIDGNHGGAYDTRYVVTANGTVYAIVVVNLQQAQDFVSHYPAETIPGYEPDFPGDVFNDFSDTKAYLTGMQNMDPQTADEMAMAYVMDKWHMGTALLKQDSNGDFKRLGTTQTINPDGSKTFNSSNCQ